MFLTKYKQSPYYQIVYFVDGRRTKKSTGTRSLTKAERFLSTFNPRENENNLKVSHNSSITLSKFRDEYLSYCKLSKSISYIKGSVEPTFNFFIQSFGNKNLGKITIKEIEISLLKKFKDSPSAALLYYRTFKAAINKAISWDYLSENHLKKIKLPKQVKSFPIFISKEELEKILDHTNHQFLKDIFVTANFSGMRLGELLSMNWSWVDFSGNIITVKNSSSFITKSKKERIIPIHKKVREILERRFSTNNKSKFVFYRYNDVRLNEDFVSMDN